MKIFMGHKVVRRAEAARNAEPTYVTEIKKHGFATDIEAMGKFLPYFFAGFVCGPFRFNVNEENSRNKNLISRAILHSIPGATDMLAVHVNFMCEFKSFRGARIDVGGEKITAVESATVHLSKMHLTARSWTDQKRIDAAGTSSILIAGRSIHNQSKVWSVREENFVGLWKQLGLDSGANILGVLNTEYPSDYGRRLGAILAESIRVLAMYRFLNKDVDLTFDLDNSFL